MRTKLLNWNSTVSKYNSKAQLAEVSGASSIKENGWDKYLNYLTKKKVIENLPDAGDVSTFKSLKSYYTSFMDTNPSAGALEDRANLMHPSVSKVMSCPISHEPTLTNPYRSGFRLEIKTGPAPSNPKWFNGVAIQLNKLDKKYIDSIKNYEFVFEYIKKSPDGNSPTANTALVYRILFNKNTSPMNGSKNYAPADIPTPIPINGANSSSGLLAGSLVARSYNIEEGLFFIDKEMIRLVSTSLGGQLMYNNANFSGGEEYSFVFYMRSNDPAMPPLKISHVTFSNCLEIVMDEAFTYGRDNLTNFTQSKKTGIYFPDLNEFNKVLSGRVSLLTQTEANRLDIIAFKNNLNTPFFFMPYCEPGEELDKNQITDNQEVWDYTRLNYSQGGLYILDPSLDFSVKNWDNSDVQIKLKEYK